ncbi:AAA family ATPase [Tsukamurella sp. 8F]|uniref:ATP-binding protein n=1 Tax=unclassified Tsukamurella TaxID=2633480 RepID=UPI0023BA1BFD|nr:MULTISPECIES: AAA family ATPase [unclassified Tsukamurella]MDF0530334.1 AAA family ATPase [Tsukamurella sp. 8J]MDF0587631.1 AAA family ATPase [Tsukamurella sp. 8F]
MRLHRLKVTDFRGVAAREVEFAATGVTLLTGPNEAGKSSLLEALGLLLEVKSTSKSRRVEAVLPADRDVAPEVEAELTVGPYRFVYAKRWYRKAATTLTVSEPAPQQLTGGSAESWVRSVLDTHVDPDLLAALTVLQGPAPGQPELRDSTAFASALSRTAAPDDAHADADGSLYDAVAAERARYYTPTGRETGELAQARARAAGATAAVDAARVALADVDAAVARHRQAVAQLEEVVAESESAAAAHAALTEEETRVSALRAELRQARSAAETAEHRERLVHRELAARRALASRHEDAAARGAELRAARDRALADRDVRAAELTWMSTTVDELGVVAADRRERKAQAQFVFDYAREASRYQRLHERIEAAELLEKEVGAIRARMSEIVVDRRVVQAVQAAEQRVERTQARFSALAATVRLERLGFGDVMVDGRLIGEEPVELVAGDGTVIDVPGAVHIEIRQRGESAAASEELRTATAELGAVCRDAGAASPDEIRELYEARLQLEVELQETRIELARTLGDDQLDALRAQLVETSELLAELEAAAGGEALDVSIDEAKQRHLAAVADELSARRAYEQAGAGLEQHQKELRAADTQAQVAAAHLAALDETLSAAAAELAADRERATDEELEASADAAAETARAADSEYARLDEAARAADLDGFAERLTRSGRRVERARLAEAEARGALSRTEGLLDSYRSEGRRDVADAAERELAVAGEVLSAVAARARAADLLHRTLARHRDEQRARVQRPFQEALEYLGRNVFGDRLTITVGDDLAIASRTVDGVTVPFASLSGGAQEQLGILSRLACARLVDADDGAPVLIDDALGHSDPERLAAMCEAIAAAGRDAQVIVFSCDAERFAGLRGRDGVTEIDVPGAEL